VHHLLSMCAMCMLKSEEGFHHQSVCVLNIMVTVWCVNGCFKELIVLRVTSTLICLNRFVMCQIRVLTCESYIFIVPYFTACYSTGILVRFSIYVFPSLSCSWANCAYI
jgi:hypothetical protein